MNRAERKRLLKALGHPDAQLIVTHTVGQMCRALRKVYGFGDIRLQRLMDFIVKEKPNEVLDLSDPACRTIDGL